MKVKIFTLVFLFCLAGILQAQPSRDYIKEAGYQYFRINDTISFSSNDSIRFVMNIEHKAEKPTVIWFRGSLAQPIIFYSDSSSVCYLNGLISAKWLKTFNFVIINKPGVKIAYDEGAYYQNRNNAYSDEACFTKNDWKNYYVSSTGQVISYLKNSGLIKGDVYLVGHSQGYHDACALAASYPESFNKLVLMSAGPFDRVSYLIRDIRINEQQGKLSANEAQHQVDSLYAYWSKVKNIVESYDMYSKELPINYYYFRYDYSYSLGTTSFDYMLKIEKPTLVVYGTNDNVSLDNDLLPLFFLRAGKKNITTRVYPGYDHNFFASSNSHAEYNPDDYHWREVSNEFFEWLLSKE